ncbi:hypothetical protein CC80DRAFT_238118 [Byssothecium circinans]|uniref:Uncharacterized protein n=1 Tax=Byssothecium circinans TaxID=147558 RepID=A0A6A5U9C4_9PLEO|nr:hypothetical protein CC80DRAFT_238118 [Byssothecium circinans]
MSTVTCTITAVKVNPFDDMYAIPLTGGLGSPMYFERDEHGPARDREAITYHIAKIPDEVAVPFLDKLEPIPSPEKTEFAALTDSPVSSTGTCAKLSSSELESDAPVAPIEWTEGDLCYLLAALYPDQMLAQDFTFTPALSTLTSTSTSPSNPIKIDLYLRIPALAVPKEAYSATLPIGTGRPTTKVLVASSAPSTSPEAARRSLAAALLKDRAAIEFFASHYGLLARLYGLDTAELMGIKKGMESMASINEKEWSERLNQLREGDEAPATTIGEEKNEANGAAKETGAGDKWCFEAELELFLLGAGWYELGRWIGAVDVAVGLGEERMGWARVYGDAGRWLEKALEEF